VGTDYIIENIVKKTVKGSIILLQNGAENDYLLKRKEQVVKALPEIIDQLKEKGFKFSTLDHLTSSAENKNSLLNKFKFKKIVLNDQEKLNLLKIARKSLQNYYLKGEISSRDKKTTQHTIADNLVGVTLHFHKNCQITKYSHNSTLVAAVSNATKKLISEIHNNPLLKNYNSEEIKVEIDIFKNPVEVWYRRLDNLDKEIKLGVHGLILEYQGKSNIVKPNLAIIKNWDLEELLNYLCHDKIKLKTNIWRNYDIKLYKFESINFIENKVAGFIDLYQGKEYIDFNKINHDIIRKALTHIGKWYIKNQNLDGTYPYTFYPGIYSYSGLDVAPMHATNSYVMALLGKLTKNESFNLSNQNSIMYLLKKVNFLDANSGLPYISFEEINKLSIGDLGTTGLTLLTIAELDQGNKFYSWADKLANSIIFMQNQDGSFNTYFEPEYWKGAQNYYPFEAMLGLVKYYLIKKEPEYLKCLKAGFNYYSNYWQNNKNITSIPWQSSVFAELYRITLDDQYADFVFEMNDWFLNTKIQYDTTNTPDISYIGGFQNFGPVKVTTGGFLKGLIEAYDIAKRKQDKERMEHYGKATVGMTKFILNFYFRLNWDDIYCSKKLNKLFKLLVNNGLVFDHIAHSTVGLTKLLKYMSKQEMQSLILDIKKDISNEQRAPPEVALKLIKKIRHPNIRTPKSVKFSPDGKYVFLHNLSAHNTAIIDAHTFEILDFIKYDGRPCEMDLTENGRLLWISLAALEGEKYPPYIPEGSSTNWREYNFPSVVIVYDTVLKKIIKRINVEVKPKIVKESPNGKYILVSNFNSNSVSVISPKDFKVVKSIPVGKLPRGICFTSNSRYAYIANMESGTLSMVDMEKLKIVDTIKENIGGGCRHLITSRDGTYIYISNSAKNGEIKKFSTEQNKVIKSANTGKYTRTIVLSPNEEYVFGVNYRSHNISIIETKNMKVVNTVEAGLDPVGMDISPDGKRLWVTNFGSRSVFVYDVIKLR